MSRASRMALVAVTAVLVLVMLLGCSFMLRDAAEQTGWYIKLNVKTPAAKAVDVSEHAVTGLSISVYDPDDQLLDAIEWDAESGSMSYLVPVTQTGIHHLQVTHFSEEAGQVVAEATESAAFNIEAMVITVIDIVPGCVGVIDVKPGQIIDEDPFAWLYGCWTGEPAAAPYTSYLEISEEGTWQWWDRYDGSGGVTDSGVWYEEDGVLYIVAGGMPIPTDVVKLSDNAVIFVAMGDAPLYRRGFEPWGYVFDQEPMPLTLSSGEWTEATIEDFQMQLYSFQAPAAGVYEISWKEQGDPDAPTFTASVSVSAYEEDRSTAFFEFEEMSGYYTPMSVSLEMGQSIYIVADAWFAGGTYGIRVQQQ